MSEWKKEKFLDVVSLNPRISLEKGVEYPFVEMSNAVPGARRPEKDVYQKYSGGGTKFEEGDTVVARIEPCLQNGKGFQCSYKKGFGSTEFLVFRPMNIKEMDHNFLYYYMGQQSIREAMAKTMVGASGRQRVNNAVFNDLQINLPPLSIQQDIATILSRYDSLIENYQKQIKLLEEAAQRLYKEWFVDLRFPGHENTKIVDGVPEGWEKKKLGEIADINKRNIPKNHNLPYIDYTDLGSVRVGNIDNPFRYNTGEEPGRAKRVAIDGDIIWGMVRPNLKSYALIQYPQKYDVFSTGFAVLSATKVPFSFLYCALTTDSFVGYLMNCTNGAAYPAVKPEHFAAAKLLIPSLDCIEAFDLKIKLCFRKIHIIQTQIRHLTEARDRLLPKLMSGEIEV